MTKRAGIAVALGFVGAALCAATAVAADYTSAYSDIDLDQCLVMSSDDFGSRWACPGYKGMPLMIAEGDLRFFVSFGFGAGDERAAGQTPPPFNYLGKKIEWRLSNASGDWRPFAAIVRYFVTREEGEKEGQVLVVTQIAPGATCHIAYIDALANPNANELARQAADNAAPDFDCTQDPEIAGDFAAW